MFSSIFITSPVQPDSLPQSSRDIRGSRAYSHLLCTIPGVWFETFVEATTTTPLFRWLPRLLVLLKNCAQTDICDYLWIFSAAVWGLTRCAWVIAEHQPQESFFFFFLFFFFLSYGLLESHFFSEASELMNSSIWLGQGRPLMFRNGNTIPLKGWLTHNGLSRGSLQRLIHLDWNRLKW